MRFVLLLIVVSLSSVGLAVESDYFPIDRSRRAAPIEESVELNPDQALTIAVNESMTPIGNLILPKVSGANPPETIFQAQMGPHLLAKSNEADLLLTLLMGLKLQGQVFPMGASTNKDVVVSSAIWLAKRLAVIITRPKDEIWSQVRVGNENKSEDFSSFYSRELSVVLSVLQNPLVRPSKSGYWSTLVASSKDRAARKIFWKTLSSNLINTPSNFFDVDESRQINALNEIIGLALRERTQEIFTLSTCNFEMKIKQR